MKKLLLFFTLLILMTSCSGKKTILRNAETYLKEHIGDPKSYNRIEWKITDTAFLNDFRLKDASDSVQLEKNQLLKLAEEQKQQSSDISALRLIILENRKVAHPKTIYNETAPHRWRLVEDNHYKFYFLDELDDAIKDSMYLIQSIIKTQTRIDELEKLSVNLEITRRNSQIVSIYMYIRFRAKLASQYPLTYKGQIEYDYDNKTYHVIDIPFDGIENKVKKY